MPLLKDLPLDVIIQECCQEATRQDRNTEEGYCFELFRRALDEQNEEAWVALQQQYHRLVLQWCYAVARDLSQEESEDIARESIERFWRTLRQVTITERFEHVGGLLKYLQQCVVSTILDNRRQEGRRKRLMERMYLSEAVGQAVMSPEREALDRIMHEEQFRRVREWIREHITDPQELLVIKGSFEEDLKPAEIAQRYPEVFPSIQVVRQIKERILKRLRRALAE